MQKFYSSFTFMLAFMILTLIMNMTLGVKPTEYFLLLVLLSMCIMNSDKIANLAGKIGGN